MTKIMTLNVRISTAEKELLQRISDDNSRSASSMVRYLIRQEAKRLDLLAAPPAELEPAQP